MRQEICSIILLPFQVLTLVALQRSIFIKTFFLFILNFYKFIWQLNAHLYIVLLAKNWIIMFLVNLKTRYIIDLRLCFDAKVSGSSGIEDEILLGKEVLWKVKRGKKII